MAEKLNAPQPTGVHEAVLKSLVEKAQGLKTKMDTVRGEYGAAIKDAEETHDVDRKAFTLALKLMRMETAQREAFLLALADYCNKLAISPQGDLFAAQPEAPKTDPVADNVRALKNIKQLEKA